MVKNNNVVLTDQAIWLFKVSINFKQEGHIVIVVAAAAAIVGGWVEATTVFGTYIHFKVLQGPSIGATPADQQDEEDPISLISVVTHLDPR